MEEGRKKMEDLKKRYKWKEDMDKKGNHSYCAMKIVRVRVTEQEIKEILAYFLLPLLFRIL